MIPIATTNEHINSHGGLNLIGKLVDKLCPLGERFLPKPGQHGDRLSDVDLLKTQIGLYSMGRSHYEDIEPFRLPGIDPDGDAAHSRSAANSFSQSMGTAFVPSESSLRTGIKALAQDEHALASIQDMALGVIASQSIGCIDAQGYKFVPCDVDVSTFDNSGSHREGLGRTYQGYDGFAPIFAYFGTQGWCIDHELRPGTQHCQKQTPEFLKRMLGRIAKLELKNEVLVRMDSGNDSADTLAVLRESGHRFIVKRNLRQESPIKWLEQAKAQGKVVERPRAGKEVYMGTLEHLVPGGESSDQKPLTVIYRVVERSIDKRGQGLLINEVEVETYWTNLWFGPAEIIELYHQHGTSEQFHSEIKGDLGLERFPSRSYAVNGLLLALGVLSYNLLRVVDELAKQPEARASWPQRIKEVQRRRVGSVVRDIIAVAGKMVSHAGKVVMKLSRNWGWHDVIHAVDRAIAKLRPVELAKAT